VAGPYFVSALIAYEFNLATASTLNLAIDVNGVAVIVANPVIAFAVVGSVFTTGLSSVVNLKVGDVLTITALSTVPAALVNYGSQALPLGGLTSLSIFSLF
jgi:hypothetical protein